MGSSALPARTVISCGCVATWWACNMARVIEDLPGSTRATSVMEVYPEAEVNGSNHNEVIGVVRIRLEVHSDLKHFASLLLS